MHRCHGASTDINVEATRAVTKLKATITQRFKVDDVEFYVEADCRFCFYFEEIDGQWGAQLVRHWHEKDKMILSDPTKGLQLEIDEYKLNKYLTGRHIDTVNLEKHDELYWLAKRWMGGEHIEV